jgi:hypothetical protein
MMALDREIVTMVNNDQGDGPPQKTPEQIAQRWLDAIQSADRRNKPYITRGRQILRRYRNKRTLTTLGVPLANRRMNVLWSNVQTQKPVMYAQTPKANVSRRVKSKDAIGRVSSIVLQNCLQNSMAMEDFDFIMGQIVEDRLLPGRGVAMVEYVPQVEENQVGWQAAETRYVHWEDFICGPGRVWQEVEWVGYWVYLSRKQVYDIALRNSGDEEFAQDVWANITLDHREDKKADDQGRAQGEPAKARVAVVWDKVGKQVIQIAPGYPRAPLGILPPPVNFDHFYPMPRPLNATMTNDTVLPVPDFEQYVDQADEIDMLTQRINVLAKSLRLRGLYPADMDSLKQLAEAGDADMIPYDQWQLIQERGGAEALVLWFPVEAIAKTLIQCIEARREAIEIMYEITGVSDIMRGATEASETATAQQLKAQFGGIRIRESQKDVQRFIRDILRLKAEVICEHFTLDVIKAMSGVRLLTDQEKQVVGQAAQLWQQFEQMGQQYQQAVSQAQQQGMDPAALPPPPSPPPVPQPSEEMLEALKEPSWDQIMAVLRNEKLRGFIVDVETDSTIEPDQQAQQQAASEFVIAVTTFMEKAAPVLQVAPEAVDMMGDMLSWAANQWKGADTVVGSIDEFVDRMKKKAEASAANPNQGIPPEVMVEQAKQQTEQIKAQAAMMKANAEIEKQKLEIQKLQMEIDASREEGWREVQAGKMQRDAAGEDHERKLELIDRKSRASAEASA